MTDLRYRTGHEHLRDGASYIARILSGAFTLSLVICAFAAAVVAVLVWLDLMRVPDLAFLKNYRPVGSIEIFDNKDRLVCVVESDANRVVVPLSQIPPQVKLAVLAAEDRQFYLHKGISFKGVLRAMVANVEARHIVEGGSTITQQLVKNLFFVEGERSFDRKIAEAMIALEIERRYTKDQILEMYLNEIYFGNSANGIEQAALRYFGKDVGRLNLAESAFIAGVIRSPVLGSADRKTEAIARQRQVLDSMEECGYITHFQNMRAKFVTLAFKSALPPKQQHSFNVYPYYVSYVLELVKNKFTDTIMKREGLKIYTNLDTAAQQTGEHILAQEIKLAPRGITDEALVSVAVKDGAVRAIVGGAASYWSNQWNCATNPHTVGSVFKPFVYLAAFTKGVLSPESTIDDGPLTVHQVDADDYSPKNFDNKFRGKITVREALSQSRNVPAVKVAQMVGMDHVIAVAEDAGISGKIAPNISSALGSSALAPLDVAAAYGTFARGGISIQPWVLRRVENQRNQVLETYEPIAHRVFPEEPVAWLVSILKDVVKNGTGTQARLSDRPCAGKTGTADQAKDIWFVGFTPDMVTAVWGGNDKNLPIANKHVTGGTVMARLWREFNSAYYAKNPLPAGALFVSRYEDADGKLNDKPIDPVDNKSIDKPALKSNSPNRSTRHSHSHMPTATRAAESITRAPITRRQNGITEYQWTH